MNAHLQEGVKSLEISAVVFNADGTVKKDLGVIHYRHRNPLKTWWWKVKRGVKKWLPSL